MTERSAEKHACEGCHTRRIPREGWIWSRLDGRDIVTCSLRCAMRVHGEEPETAPLRREWEEAA